MINILFSRLCILTCGTLYPGYNSFKTVRAKNVDGYVKWMMYWIVFSIFTSIETFSDIFLTWFPFYYEFKVVFILWLLPTTGNGSSFIYKNFIHPLLKKHETLIDFHLEKIREKGLDVVMQYMKEAVLFIGLIANHNLPNRSLQNSENIIIEEIEVQQIGEKLTNQRKSYKKTRKNKDAEEAHSAQTRGRKIRQSKQEVDSNSNER